jgi:hypothetical protein
MSWLDIDLVQVQDRGFSFEVFKSRKSNQTIARPLQRWNQTLPSNFRPGMWKYRIRLLDVIKTAAPRVNTGSSGSGE